MAQTHHSAQGAKLSVPSSLEESLDLFTHAPIGIFTSTPQGRFISVNPTMASMHGYDSPQELVESITDIANQLYVDPSDREEFLRLMQEQGEVVNNECRMRRKDGSIIWVSRHAREVRDINGKITYYQGFVTDITEQKRMEQSICHERNLTQRYLDTIQTMMVAMNQEGRITMINRSGRELLGYAEEELLGCNWFELCLPQPEGMDRIYPVFQRILAGDLTSVERYENSVVCKDGRQRLISWHNALLEDDDGKFVGVLASGEDITERRQAEEELRENQEKYQLLIENLNEGVWQINKDGYTIFVNQRMADMLGYTVQAMQGKHLFDFMDEQEAQLAKKYMQRRQAGIKEQHEHVLICKDGSHIVTSLETAPVYDKDANYIGALAGVQDITERKQALEAIRESDSRFRRLLEDVPSVAVQGYSMDGVTLYWNKASEKLYGYSAHEAIGQNLVDLIIPEEMRTQVQAEIQQMADSGEPIPSSELTMKRKDGSLVSVFSSHAIVHKHDGSAELFCIDIDLTELKKAQRALLRAKEKAEAANQAKSQFLANMSHEIRTPLNGIMGILQLLQMTEQDQEQKEYVQMAYQSSERLLRLLTDILELSKIEAGKLELRQENFELRQVLQSVQDIFRLSCQEKQISLQIQSDQDLPQLLLGDHIRLNQILFNLVGNAVKYTQQGEVGVEAYHLPGDSPELCRILFVIQDTGQGIQEDMLEQVFETFYQVENLDSPYTRQFEGAGLGLPLVKRLLHLMGGNACIASQTGQGTSVYVSLPFKVPEGLQQKNEGLQKKRQPAWVRAAHVLLVDDEKSTRFYIRRLLEKNGYRVTVAVNGEEALAELAQDQFDCVLMDVQMPVLDGVETTKRIRGMEHGAWSMGQMTEDRGQKSETGGRNSEGTSQHGRGLPVASPSSQPQLNTPVEGTPVQDRPPRMPIVALTAYAMAGDREHLLKQGLDDYLAKPVDKDELLAVLERNISGSQ